MSLREAREYETARRTQRARPSNPRRFPIDPDLGEEGAGVEESDKVFEQVRTSLTRFDGELKGIAGDGICVGATLGASGRMGRDSGNARFGDLVHGSQPRFKVAGCRR